MRVISTSPSSELCKLLFLAFAGVLAGVLGFRLAGVLTDFEGVFTGVLVEVCDVTTLLAGVFVVFLGVFSGFLKGVLAGGTGGSLKPLKLELKPLKPSLKPMKLTSFAEGQLSSSGLEKRKINKFKKNVMIKKVATHSDFQES